jgi:hypothetical protein
MPPSSSAKAALLSSMSSFGVYGLRVSVAEDYAAIPIPEPSRTTDDDPRSLPELGLGSGGDTSLAPTLCLDEDA